MGRVWAKTQSPKSYASCTRGHMTWARSLGFGMRKWFSSFLNVWLGESHLTSLNLNFLIHEMEMMIPALLTLLL